MSQFGSFFTAGSDAAWFDSATQIFNQAVQQAASNVEDIRRIDDAVHTSEQVVVEKSAEAESAAPASEQPTVSPEGPVFVIPSENDA